MKGDKKGFVPRVQRLQDLGNRLLRKGELSVYAAARIENHTDRNRGVLAGAVLDRLFFSVFKKMKPATVQTGDRVPGLIGHDRFDQDKIATDLNTRLTTLRKRS